MKHFVPTRLAFFLDSFPEVQSMRKQGRVTEPCGQMTISTVAIITHLSPQTSLSRPGRPRRPSGLSLRTSLRSLGFRIDATASYGLACPRSVIVGLIRWRHFYRQVVPRCPRALVRCTNAPCSGWPFTTHEWEFGVRPVQGHRKKSSYEHRCIRLCMDTHFRFIKVNFRKQNGWIIWQVYA